MNRIAMIAALLLAAFSASMALSCPTNAHDSRGKELANGRNWHRVPFAEIDSEIRRIFFIDERNGWGIDRYSQIGRTADGGSTWKFVDNPNQGLVTSLWFVDKESGFATGDNGFLARTKDGGLTWTKINVGDCHVGEVVFSSPSVGLATVSDGAILVTRDGGNIWTPTYPFGKAQTNGLSFTSEREGCAAAGDGVVYCTRDGANSWAKATVDHPSSVYHSVKLVGDEGWLLGVQWGRRPETRIYRTRDGGRSWQESEKFVGVGRNVFISPSGRAWIVGIDNRRGIDEGARFLFWQKRTFFWGWGSEEAPGGESNVVHEMFFVGVQKGWMTTGDGVFETTNGGRSWAPSAPRRLSIKDRFFPCILESFLNDDEGIIGYCTSSSTVRFYSTRDGKSWVARDFSSSQGSEELRLHSLVTTQRGRALAVEGTRRCRVLETSDEGRSWSDISTFSIPIDSYCQEAILDSSPTGAIGALIKYGNTIASQDSSSRALYLSEDFGKTWKTASFPQDLFKHASWKWTGKTLEDLNIQKPAIIDRFQLGPDGAIYLFGSTPDHKTGLLYRSRDKGLSWQRIMEHEDEGRFWFNDSDVAGLAFVSPSSIFAFGSMPWMASSSDDGKTWTSTQPLVRETASNGEFTRKWHFWDERHGVVMTRDNVYITRDGGRTWVRDSWAKETGGGMDTANFLLHPNKDGTILLLRSGPIMLKRRSVFETP